MAFNPANMFKMKKMLAEFENSHPKFVAFFRTVFSRPVEEGTVIEVTITRPGESPITSNIVVKQSDLALFEQLKSMS